MNPSTRQHLTYGVFGLLMGAVLSFTGFSNFGQIHNMFTLSDFRLLAGFIGSIALSMLGFFLLARGKKIPRKTLNKGTIPGSVLFGTGWALTGACPSIALVQLGGGRVVALFTLFGIYFGVWAYRRLASGGLALNTAICGEE